MRKRKLHPSMEILYARRGNLAKIVRASLEAMAHDPEQRALNMKMVSRWKDLPNGIPVAHVRLVASVLGVARHKLRPDIWPPPGAKCTRSNSKFTVSSRK